MTQVNWPGDRPKPTPKRSSKRRKSILINFVLDKSGSMDVVRSATIDGFNEFLNTQRSHDGLAFLTLTMFDTQFYEVCRGIPLREMPQMEAQNYVPSGCTALYDAVAHSIRLADEQLSELRQRGKRRPDQVLFVVMTDGQENSSREFNRQQVFDMIQDRERNAGYEFIYLGANQDTYAEAAKVGVTMGKSRHWVSTDRAARKMHARLNERVSEYRASGVPHLAQIGEDWFEPNEGLDDDKDDSVTSAADSTTAK